MKNGEEIDLDLKLGDGDTLGIMLGPDEGTEMSIRTKALCDRWVTAINQRLKNDSQAEKRTEMLEERIRQLEEKLKEKATPKEEQEKQSTKENSSSNSYTEIEEALKAIYRSKQRLYPLQVLELDIKEKVSTGKTREQAIEELYKEKVEKDQST